jgi:membrane-bound metal-dependent hydrolase YbcI (DUF457 family)
MQTYTHFLVAAITGKTLKQRGVQVHKTAFLLGSFMPDVPLVLCTLWFFIYYHWLYPPPDNQFLFGQQYDNYYFHHPVWVTGHSMFHSPTMIAGWFLLACWGIRHDKKWGQLLLWFATSCGLHSLADILTHHDDGPLWFFPFNWSFRFSSPVSYWDSSHHGNIFSPIEHLVAITILTYLIVNNVWLRKKLGLKL